MLATAAAMLLRWLFIAIATWPPHIVGYCSLIAALISLLITLIRHIICRYADTGFRYAILRHIAADAISYYHYAIAAAPPLFH